MAANKVQYVLGISADTSQAKRSIQELQNALNQITTANSKKLGLDIDLNNAAKAAQQLQSSLQSAINVDTGRLNFTAFNKSLMQSNTNLNQLITQLRSTGGLGNQAVSQLARSLSTAEIPIKRMTGLLGTFSTTLMNSFKWQISSNIIHGLQSSLQSSVSYVKDLNETLNNIRIVTGQSVDDMAKFAVNANKAAKELSTTTRAYADASLIYYQQGDSAELAAKKAATTIKAANVAFTASAKEMSEMLTAVWNSYQVGEEQLEATVDVLAKLGATTASSMEEMATAMQKVASTANTVGVSMQQMSAIVATSASVTRQAPQTVGTAWNTILSRIGGLKLGETLEDGVDLNKYSKALQTVGISILDATGEMRDMGTVIDELGTKWQGLSKGQKAALAQTIGGARQYTQIMAFFDNFDKYQKNMITAQNAQGALQEQQEIYAQGWEAASARSRAALEELWSALINDKAMISFTNGMTKMTEGVTGLVKAFGGLPGILATVSALMTRTFSNQIVSGVSKAAAGIVGFGQAFTKNGNGQPMSGGYTIGQLLTGRMPNAEERQQISNLAVTRDVLLQTAKTGAGLDQENPFYNELRQSNGLQAGAYSAQIQAMRQGSNLTPVQMLNLANLQQRAQHTQNAYDILGAFHEDTSTVTSNLINTDQGASEIFSKLSGAMYREELEKIQDRAINATGDELKAYQSQFADIAKKANLDVAFGQYKRADSFKSSATLMREMGAREYAGLTEAERRQIIADTRQSTAQSIQATKSQFNTSGQVDPASKFKAIGEAARTATIGLTSGVAAFNQLNSAMAAFNSGNVVQGLTSVATTATSVAQAFIVGGPVAGAIASAGAVLGLVVGQYTADMEKAANKAKETTEKITNSTQELEAKVSNIATQSNGYDALVEQLSKGAITQDEFNNSLLTVANSLGVQGANVLALSGNYKELEEQVKQTIAAQLQQAEVSGKTLASQAQDATSSTLYTAFGTYGVKTAAFTRPGSDKYTIKNGYNAGAAVQLADPYEGWSYLENTLGVKFNNATKEFTLGSDFDSLSKFLHGIKQLEEEAEANFGTARGSAIYNFLNDSSFRKVRSAAETAIAPVSSGLRGQYSAAGQQFVAGLNTSILSGYNMQARQGLIDQFLGQQGLSEENNPEAYQIGKEIISSLVDSTIAGMGAEGAKLSASASTAANKKQDYTKRLKAMGLNSDTIIGGLTDEQLNSSLGLGYWMAGGRSNINTTARDAWAISQSALEAYNNRGSNFNVGSFADQYIYSNSALSEYAGVSQEEFKKLSTDAQRHILVNWIDAIKNASDELSTAADNNDFASALTDAWNNFINDWGESIGGDLLDESQFRSILNYSKEAFTEDSQKTEDEQSDIYKLIQDRFNGDYQAAQKWSQIAIDTNPNLGTKASAAQDTPLGQLISQAQTLANMDIKDITKWKEAYEDIAQSLAHHDISIDRWLNMSELEKRQTQLVMLQEKIQEIRANMAKEGTGENDELIELEYQFQQLQDETNNLTLENLKRELNDVQNQWKEMGEAAETALGIISSHIGDFGNMSFVDIERLRQSLIAAGVELNKVNALMDELYSTSADGKQDKSDIWAGATAAGIAALQSITAQRAQNKGLYDLDITVGKDEVEEHSKNWPAKHDVTLTAENDQVKTTIESWDLDNQKVTIKTVDGKVVEEKITSWDANLSNKTLTVKLSNGETVTSTIDSWNANLQDKKMQVTLENGEVVTTTIDNWQADLSTNTFVITDVNGNQVTTSIESWDTDLNNKTLKIKTVDGTKVDTEIKTWTADLANKKLSIETVDGTKVDTEIKSWTANLSNKSLKITTVDGQTVDTQIDTWETDLTTNTWKVQTVDGTTVTNQIDAWKLSLDGNKLTVTVEDGSEEGHTITSTITDWVDNADGSVTVTLEDGSKTKITSDIADAIKTADNNKAVSITYSETNGQVRITATQEETKVIKVAYEIDKDAYRQWLNVQDVAVRSQGGDPANFLSSEHYGAQLLSGKYNGGTGREYALSFHNQITSRAGQIDFNDNAIKESVTQLWQIAQSENGELSSIGQFLIAGLKQGIAEAGNASDWSAFIESLGLGEDVIQAFKDALGIASPSKLTEALGIYLIEGLQKGIDRSIASWTPNVSGLAGKLNDAFKKSLGNFSAQDYIRDAMDKDPMLGYRGAVNQLNGYLNTQSTDFYRNFLSGGYLSSDLSEDAQLALSDLLKETGYTNEEIRQMSAEEIDKLVDSLDSKWKRALEKVENNTKLTIATMQDVWKNGLQQIFEDEQDIADKTYDKWESTFKAIANARKSLLNGNAIIDDIIGDKDSATTLLRYLMESAGMSYSDAVGYLNNPHANFNQLSFEAYTANARAANHGGSNQFFSDGDTLPSYSEYNENRRNWILKNLSSPEALQSLNAVLNASPNKASILGQMYDFGNGNQSLQDILSQNGFIDQVTGDIISGSDPKWLVNILLSTLFSTGSSGTQQLLDHMGAKIGYQNESDMQQGWYEMKATDMMGHAEENNEAWKEQAELVGMNVSQLKEYAEMVERVNNRTVNWASLTKDEQAQLAINARKIKQTQDAWEDLTTKQKENMKTVAKLGQKGGQVTGEQLGALSSLTKSVKQFFGNSEKVTEQFVRENIKDIQKMVKGDENALERLQDKLIETTLGNDFNKPITIEVNGQTAETTLGNLIDDFEDKFKTLNDGAIVTPEIDTSGATAALIDLLNQGGDTAEGIMQALNQVGWQPQVAYKEVPYSELTQVNGVAQVPVIDYTEDGLIGGYHMEAAPVSGDVDQNTMIKIPIIEDGKIQYSGLQKTGAGQSSGRKPPKGGGGGGKEHKKKDHKRVKDEGERYHEIRDKMEQQEHILDRIDKIKDRAYGGRHLKALNDEIEALEKQNKLAQEYYAEAAAYLASDRAELTSYGATFNEDGTINYEEYIRKQVAWYNAAVDASDSDERDKEIEQEYQDRMKALENYEEALDLVDTIQNEILERQNKISELLLEGIKYKMELQIDLDERDIKILDYYITKWSDLLNMQDESMDKTINKVQDYEKTLATLGEAYQNLVAAQLTGKLNDTDFAEGLKDIQDQTVEALTQINELKKAINEYYNTTLQLAEDKLSKYDNKIKHSRDMMQSYIEMQQLMGRGQNFAELNDMYQASYESSLLTAKAARDYLDNLLAARERLMAQVEESGWNETLQQQFDDLEEHIISAEDDLMSKTQQTLEDAKAKFENAMQALVKSLDYAFGEFEDANNNLVRSFDAVAEDFNYWNEQQGWYVSTAKELYEVSKINRQIEDSIADQTTALSKERLKNLKEEINAYAEKNRLTEYDIEMNELQYKMALAMGQLEDAQNAKSTVRLTRDENGNMGYQYTANEDDVSAARQNFEDVLQQINELSSEHQNDLMQQYIEAKQNYQQQIMEIYQDDTLSLEERNEKAERLTEQHIQTIEYLQAQMERSQEHLLENQGYIMDWYGHTIIENTGMVQDQIHEMMTNMINNTGDYVKYIREQFAQGVEEALTNYQTDLSDTEDQSGNSWDNMAGSITHYNEVNEQAASTMTDLNSVLDDTLKHISSTTDKWLEHADALSAVQQNYETLLPVIQTTLTALANANNITDRYYNNGALNRPKDEYDDAMLLAEYISQNKTNFSDIDLKSDKLKDLVSEHLTTMNEYDISSSIWKTLWDMAYSGLITGILNDSNRTLAERTEATNNIAQAVTINADFSNVESAAEIRDAFEQLMNLASQYAYGEGSGS